MAWARGDKVTGAEVVNYVAFTFDDGPEPETTPQVLAILEAHRVPAAFFVVGRHFIGDSPAALEGARLLRSMSAAGFLIGNHTLAHQSLAKQPFARAAASITDNALELAKILGYEPRLFRPPYGAMTSKTRKLLRERGDTLVRWNIDPKDFRKARQNTLQAYVVKKILSKKGGIVLMHDTKAATAHALEGILNDLQSANCQRMARGLPPILPVSLHYFMQEQDGSARAVPPEVMKTTQNSLEALHKACQIDN